VGVAVETPQRRFFAGDEISTNVYVTNDDEQFRDLDDLTIRITAAAPDPALVSADDTKLDRLDYYKTAKLPVRLNFTSNISVARFATELVIRVMSHGKLLAESRDPIEIFARPSAPAPEQPTGNVVVIKKGASIADLAPNEPLYERIRSGATAIVFSPPTSIARLFPDDLISDEKKPTTGKSAAESKKPDFIEYADWMPVRGTPLAGGLRPMDLKWWVRPNDERAFIGSISRRLKPGGTARELIRYIPSHGYISEEKVPEQYRCVMLEIPIGKGRLWICDLDIDACATVDPAARLMADNLYRAAADPNSTKNLPTVPTHEQMLKGIRVK
jgi:hypothetical protein